MEDSVKQRTRLLTTSEVDHPAPQRCPDCGAKLISSLRYPFEGEIHESGYCPECNEHIPEPRGRWTKWKPKPSDFFAAEAE